MRHKYIELDERDRYQIGDWVLQAGEPYQWQSDDYYRGIRGMQSIKPMPMSTEVLEALDMNARSQYTEGDMCCTNYDSRGLGVEFVVRMYYYTYKNGKPPRYVLNVWRFYDEHDHRYIGKVNYVHELQSALRSVQLYDLAEGLKL